MAVPRYDFESWLLLGLAAFTAIVLGVVAGVDPKLAIAGSFALGFIVLVVADLNAGLVAFTFLAFIEIVPFGGPALSFTKLLGLLLAISWLGVMAARRDVAVDRAVLRPVLYALSALLGWILLSATWATEPTSSLLDLTRYALNAMLFVIVATSVRERSTAIWLIGAFVAGAALAALYGIASPGRFEADYGRLESASLDPNELAAVLVPAAVTCMFVAIGMRKATLVRVAAGFVGFLCVATIALTVSRGGLIAFTFALLVAIAVGGRWRLPIALFTAVLAASVFIYFAGFASPAAVDHLKSTTQGDARFQEGRVTIWQIAGRMAKDNPVRGVGAGNFAARSPDYVIQPGQVARSELLIDTPSVVHNTSLEVLVELGAIGLGLFLAVIGLCTLSLVRAARVFNRLGDLTMELLSRSLIAALMGLLVANFFISEQFSKAMWLLLALGPALLVIARHENDSREATG